MANLLRLLNYFLRRITLLIFPGFGNGNAGWLESDTIVGLIINEPLLLLCVCLVFIISIISVFNRIRRLL